MATVKGVNKTLVDAGGQSQIAQGQVDARLKVYTDSYTPAGTEAAGTVIQMGPTLPAGARIRNIRVINAAQAASVTLAVGDSNSTARYIAAYAADSLLVSGAIKAAGFDYVIGTNSGDNQIQILTAGATLNTGVIKIEITVSVD